MNTLWGLVLVVFSLGLCWLGQVVSALAPRLAERLGLTEREADVDPVFHADAHAEAIWDAWSLWPLPVAGILLLLDHPAWPYFGLVGGGMYLYFAGRGVVVRLVLRRRQVRIGQPRMLAVYQAYLVFFGALGAGTVWLAVRALAGR